MDIFRKAIEMAKIAIDRANITVNSSGDKVEMRLRRNGDVVDIVGQTETIVGRVELPKVTVIVNDGTVLNLSVEGDVTCGAVTGKVSVGGNIYAAAINNNAQAGGDISCTGIGGNVWAGGDVTCKGTISGKNISAGGDVNIRGN